jgi:hypothetical protein
MVWYQDGGTMSDNLACVIITIVVLIFWAYVIWMLQKD